MFKMHFFLLVGMSLFLTTETTFQDCLYAMDTSCDKGTHDNTQYCLTNGQIINGSCNFHKEFCIQTYFHNETFNVHGIGPSCRPYNPHINLNITTGLMNLYSNIVHGIDDRLEVVAKSGSSPQDAITIFSKQDHTNKVYIRNTHCWAYGIDLSCISPWNSDGQTRKAGTLLSPRHAIWARHYSIQVNSILRFVDQSNNVFDRKIIKASALPVNSTSGFLYGYDMVIGLLDSDVPSSVSFAKVLPKYIKAFNPMQAFVRLPTICTDFEEKALVDDFLSQASNMASLTIPLSNTTRHQYYENKITGDSGNPCFFVVDNELVFLFVFTYGGSGSGTSIQFHQNEVNAIMRDLGGGYQLTEINLSKYLTDNDITHIFG